MVANKYAFLQITRRRFLNEWEAFKKVISRRNIRRRITIPLTLSNLKLLRRITGTENILHRNFTRRQVAIQNRVDRNSGSAGMPRPISYAVFCLKKNNKIRRHNDCVPALHSRALRGAAWIRRPGSRLASRAWPDRPTQGGQCPTLARHGSSRSGRR